MPDIWVVSFDPRSRNDSHVIEEEMEAHRVSDNRRDAKTLGR